nr:MAG TPA: hypothetical protein [Caudoviricetes sp.]
MNNENRYNKKINHAKDCKNIHLVSYILIPFEYIFYLSRCHISLMMSG